MLLLDAVTINEAAADKLRDVHTCMINKSLADNKAVTAELLRASLAPLGSVARQSSRRPQGGHMKPLYQSILGGIFPTPQQAEADEDRLPDMIAECERCLARDGSEETRRKLRDITQQVGTGPKLKGKPSSKQLTNQLFTRSSQRNHRLSRKYLFKTGK